MKKILFIVIFTTLFLTILAQTQPPAPRATSKKIALTFDACMTSGMAKKLDAGTEKSLYNANIIEYLQQEKVPATIFMAGLWAEKYPDAVKAIAADPLFEIGNHSYSHRAFTADCFSLPTIPDNEKEADIRKAQETLTRLSGRKPQFFRFPGGCYKPADLTLMRNLGLKVIGWTFPSGDAFNSNADAITENVLNKSKPGAIVVFHLMGGRYAPKTLEVIKLIVPELKKRGFEFVTVSVLLDPGKKI